MYIHFVMKDIEHYRTLAEANARQTKEEALVFMGGHTQNLILGKKVQVNHIITDLFQYGFPLFRDHCSANQDLGAGGRVTVTSEEQEKINIFLI